MGTILLAQTRNLEDGHSMTMHLVVDVDWEDPHAHDCTITDLCQLHWDTLWLLVGQECRLLWQQCPLLLWVDCCLSM